MDTQVRTPQLVFMQPQRLIVPLFQRPYVWNKESQWAPLWADVTRVAERLLANPKHQHHPHFLGAVVLQQVQTPTGSMQVRTVIDGQQRLTTLQLLLDALQAELAAVGASQSGLRIAPLVTNDSPFWDHPEDRFKVWPTNRDRAAFNEVMGADPPIKYTSLTHHTARLVQAHQFFAEQGRAWLNVDGPNAIADRAAALEQTARELLQLVVIDLTADENAQEIFETLNARGAQLTAADLIKNFVFQRLTESGVDVEAAYEENWKQFETGFWETEVSFGRLKHSRSSIFLNHWLIAHTGEVVVASEVFARFKRYADESGVPMAELIKQLRRAAEVYRSFIEGSKKAGSVDRLALFAYRTDTLESEVFKPVILALLDPEQPELPADQLHRALNALESWLVRRALIRASSNSYTQVASEIVSQVLKSDRQAAGDAVVQFLREQTVSSRYWPDDEELRAALHGLLAYARLRRARLRMMLESLEDNRRGFVGETEGLGGERVARGKYHIEHLMPQKWETNWGPLADAAREAERNQLIHTLGNLTLLTGPLNSKVSNSAWALKRPVLKEHDVLKITMDLPEADEPWDESSIRARTGRLADQLVAIWPVPEGHKSAFGSQPAQPGVKVHIADLIGSGLLESGATIYPRAKKHHGRTATVLPDGHIDVDGTAFGSPSAAATAISGKAESGWNFFRLGPKDSRTLFDLWREYVDQTRIDADEADVAENDDEADNGADGDENDGGEETGNSRRRPWSLGDVLDHLTSLCQASTVDEVHALLDAVTSQGGHLYPGSGAYPTMSAYLKLGAKAKNRAVFAVHADPSGPTAPRITINFGSLYKELSEADLVRVLNRLEAVEPFRSHLGKVRSEGFNTSPSIPLEAFAVGSGAEILMDAIAPYVRSAPEDRVLLGTEEEDEGEPTDRKYWESRASQEVLKTVDRLLELVHEVEPLVALKYNKQYIGLTRRGVATNFALFDPKRKAVTLALKVPKSDEVTARIEQAGLDLLSYTRWGAYRIRLLPTHIEDAHDLLVDLLRAARDNYDD